MSSSAEEKLARSASAAPKLAGEGLPMIDFHTHTQPSVAAAEEFFGWIGLPQTHRGDIDDLFANMDANGIEKTLIVPWLPAQDLVAALIAKGETREAAVAQIIARWSALNAWAASMARTYPDRIYAIVGVEPILMSPEAIEAEIALRLSEGACGIKIAPIFLDAPVTDPRVRLVWDIARRHDVFILSECGAHGTMGHEAWGHPRHLDRVVAEYPDVRLLLAHLGQGAEDVVAELTHKYPNVYTDLSLRLVGIGTPGHWTQEEAVRVIRDIGTDRVIYGTNYPIVDVAAFAETFRALPLTKDEHEAIGSRNVQNLLGERFRS